MANMTAVKGISTLGTDINMTDLNENVTKIIYDAVDNYLNTTMKGNGLFNDGLVENVTAGNDANRTAVAVTFSHVPKYELPVMIILCIVLSFLILATILGNVFVISAIILERSLQGVSNYLILSLAVTDLLVAIFVMPLSLVNEISVFWYLGNELCDFWISVDVLCCTASILHLVAISLDRFWGVSNIDYIRRRCAKQISLMIVVVWFVSVVISIPPLFGWKDPQNDPEKQGMCVISQDLGYTVFSTVGAFYCPMVLMVILNCKIYIAARSRIRKKNLIGRSKPVTSAVTHADMKTIGRSSSCSDDDGYTVCNGSMAVTCALNEDSNMQISDGEVETPLNNGEYLKVPTSNSGFTKQSINFKKVNGHLDKTDTTENSNVDETHDLVGSTIGNMVRFTDNNNHKHELMKRKKKRRDADKKRKDKMEMKRERKAAKVLGIITGAFIACWLPFFSLAVLVPFCGDLCKVPDALFSFCLWLGYFNSSLNPILYTIFNPSFRKAFHKIIYGKYRLRG